MDRTPLKNISASAWEHPADAAAMDALRALPGLAPLMKSTAGRVAGEVWKRLRTNELVPVDPESRIGRVYDDVCRILDVPQRPPLFIQTMAGLNAATGGVHSPFIVLSDKAELLPDDELGSILAHELGHILSEHLTYKMLLGMLLYTGWLAFGVPISTGAAVAIGAGLLEWDRKSELSADRAALLWAQDPGPVTAALRRAGRDPSESEEIPAWLKAVVRMTSRHPPIDERIDELEAWAASDEYSAILAGDYPRRGCEPRTDWGARLRSSAQQLDSGLRAVAAPLRGWWSSSR